MLLILTVGTGTAGKSSSLADGLVASIRLAECDCYLLVPSASSESREVADLVRECAPEGTREFSLPEEPAPELSQYDDLEQCRKEILALFHRLRECGETDLLLNPTSGTKQMSAAAILAGLEAGVAKIHYTVGKRADGVVKTGTERLQPFDPDLIHAARARADARRLLKAGAFGGARELLRPWRGIPASSFLSEASTMMGAWTRLAYQEAAGAARKLDHPKAETWTKAFAHLQAQGPGTPVVLADLLDQADFLLQHQNPESALATLYRTTEQAAKTVLHLEYGVRPPYPLEAILPIAPPAKRDLFRQRARDNHVHLGLRETMELLADCGLTLGRLYFDNRRLRHLLEQRNRSIFGHGQQAVAPDHVRELRSLLAEVMQSSDLATPPRLRRSQVIDGLLEPQP